MVLSLPPSWPSYILFSWLRKLFLLFSQLSPICSLGLISDLFLYDSDIVIYNKKYIFVLYLVSGIVLLKPLEFPK